MEEIIQQLIFHVLKRKYHHESKHLPTFTQLFQRPKELYEELKDAGLRNNSKQSSEPQIPMVLVHCIDGEWIYEDLVLEDLTKSFR